MVMKNPTFVGAVLALALIGDGVLAGMLFNVREKNRYLEEHDQRVYQSMSAFNGWTCFVQGRGAQRIVGEIEDDQGSPSMKAWRWEFLKELVEQCTPMDMSQSFWIGKNFVTITPRAYKDRPKKTTFPPNDTDLYPIVAAELTRSIDERKKEQH